MLQIKKMRSDHVIDFAAEELKKYLRMMMPHSGDIQICYEPGATDGFRLGLLEDFGLPFEGEDPVLDDAVADKILNSYQNMPDRLRMLVDALVEMDPEGWKTLDAAFAEIERRTRGGV